MSDYLIDICLRCVELRVAKSLPAEEYIKFLTELPPIEHSCGIK